MTADLTFRDARGLVERCLSLDYFTSKGSAPPAIPCHFVPGEGPLVVIVGPNAGGKSFFRRVACEVARRQETEAIHLSMEGRRNPMGGMRVFVYGDEEESATGYNSMRTVTTGIKTCRGRENEHVIVWDEPDLGLSEGNAASVGRAIADFAREPPDKTLAAVVITHRKALVAELAPLAPHYLHLGEAEAPPSLAEWLAMPLEVKPLDDLIEAHSARRRAIASILRERRHG
jgi:hypothetical protein